VDFLYRTTTLWCDSRDPVVDVMVSCSEAKLRRYGYPNSIHSRYRHPHYWFQTTAAEHHTQYHNNSQGKKRQTVKTPFLFFNRTVAPRIRRNRVYVAPQSEYILNMRSQTVRSTEDPVTIVLRRRLGGFHVPSIRNDQRFQGRVFVGGY